MKILKFAIWTLILTSCQAVNNNSCSNAIKFPNAEMMEKTVKPGFTGDLNNYWGTDTKKLDFKHSFLDGKIIQSKFYYENGKVQEEYNYKCQSLHGSMKYFYENGQLLAIVSYEFGRREGNSFKYDSLGNVRQKVIFRNDKLIGEPISYDENGNELKESTN